MLSTTPAIATRTETMTHSRKGTAGLRRRCLSRVGR
jgi:hypothetical protein